MKSIRDSVHGDLQLEEFEVALVDTPEIQRLRRIKQLGFTYLVYPGANHTRFEHSMGTMYLAGRLALNLDLDPDTRTLLRVCAALHDAGHGPFSHVSEGVLETSHEKLTSRLIRESTLGDILSERYNLKEVVGIISGQGPLGQIISGDLDVDRMDYLLRDSYYTGVAYGIIDVERLLNNMYLDGEHLTLHRKGVQAAEAMLLARYFMYPSVYQHHTTRIVNSMFRRGLGHLLKAEVIHSDEIYRYDDADIVSAARKEKGYVRDIIRRLDNRQLFKRVYSLKLDGLDDPMAVFRMDESLNRQAELEMAEDLGVEEDYILIDLPEYPAFNEHTPVSVYGSTKTLGEVSNLVVALEHARFNHADLSIYMPEEEASQVKGFPFRDYLNLP
ncbi:HD domain-containing protein [Methanobacterium sp. CWC-01]|uniref:HD domain-containing protein n=1 Tax=Methanobacterium aridiramus TaxID=2584467 RepID=UPI002577B29B|nr:HD domain-containing protein [Methanobacterium sp. CWC-01]